MLSTRIALLTTERILGQRSKNKGSKGQKNLNICSSSLIEYAFSWHIYRCPASPLGVSTYQSCQLSCIWTTISFQVRQTNHILFTGAQKRLSSVNLCTKKLKKLRQSQLNAEAVANLLLRVLRVFQEFRDLQALMDHQ